MTESSMGTTENEETAQTGAEDRYGLLDSIRKVASGEISPEDFVKEATPRIDEIADTDPLTRLHNRRRFREDVERVFREAQRKEVESPGTGKRPGTLLMLDIDYFKLVNDTHGHPVGDQVLFIVGQVIKEHTGRAGDYSARWGGEEFTVFLSDDKGVDEVASRILTDMPIFTGVIEKLPKGVTVSIGFSQARLGEELDTVLERADKALYEAKEKGRNRVVGHEA